MSQTKLSKIQIRNRPGAEDKVSVGANMEVLVDGVPLKGAKFVKFEVKAAGIAKVLVELLGTVDVDANVPLKAEYEVGQYGPARFVNDPRFDNMKSKKSKKLTE